MSGYPGHPFNCACMTCSRPAMSEPGAASGQTNTQTDPLLSLLSDVRDSIDREIDPALIQRALGLIQELKKDRRDNALAYRLLMAAFEWTPGHVLSFLASLDRRIYDLQGPERNWHPNALEYIRRLQAALQEPR